MHEHEIRILIIDDEKSQQQVIQSYLSQYGYHTDLAASGPEALELCTTLIPDLILLDLIMPDMDGIETCKRLKQISTLSGTPIIVLTSKTDSQSIEHSFAAGANDFLNKPVNPLILKNRIEYAVHTSKLFKKLETREKQLLEVQKIAKLGTVSININTGNVEILCNYFDLLGLTSQKETMSFTDFIFHVHPDDETHVRFTIDNAIENMEGYMLEYRFLSRDGKEFIIYQQGEYITGLKDPDDEYLLGTFQDVTESRSIKESLDYSRTYDPLTDLSNKTFFETQIKHVLLHPPSDSLFAIIFIGIDHFSRVNDEYGHLGGDFILKELSNRLMTYEGRGHIVSRFGGDVFSMLVKNIHHINECNAIIEEILETIRIPLTMDNNEIHLTASIGASIFPLESEKESNLLIGAEAAMMMSREQGGDRYTYRTHKMNIETQKRLLLLKEIRVALENNHFSVFYQPQIDSQSMQIVAMESLVRWIHPDRGLIPPDDFISVAEDTGLIIPIGDYVLREACAQTNKWLSMGFELDVGVNISAKQFEADDFIEKIRNTLDETGLPAQHLEVEITESMAIKNYQPTIEKLNQLREMEVKTSMDDFGTGYSSLSQLQSLPLDTLKVDQAFVRCIEPDKNAKNSDGLANTAIANAIIAMSHSLGLRVIAEGVETLEQSQFLKSHDSEILQGYLFSKPVPAMEMDSLLLHQ